MTRPPEISPPQAPGELLARFESCAHVARELEARGLAITGMGVVRWASANDGRGSIPGEYWHLMATIADEAAILGYTACLKMLALYAFETERCERAARALSPPEAGEG